MSYKMLSDNRLKASQENTVLKINHTANPINLSPLRDHDLVILEERKKIPHVYEDTKTLIAIKDTSNIDAVRTAIILNRALKCSHNPNVNGCEIFRE